jgi:hypothetical protein
VSQVALGHSKPDTTLINTHAAKARALKAIRQLDGMKPAE